MRLQRIERRGHVVSSASSEEQMDAFKVKKPRNMPWVSCLWVPEKEMDKQEGLLCVEL